MKIELAIIFPFRPINEWKMVKFSTEILLNGANKRWSCGKRKKRYLSLFNCVINERSKFRPNLQNDFNSVKRGELIYINLHFSVVYLSVLCFDFSRRRYHWILHFVIFIENTELRIELNRWKFLWYTLSYWMNSARMRAYTPQCHFNWDT